MNIRRYRETDCLPVISMFYDTVHVVAAGDYSEAQLDAWAPENADFERWNRTLLENYSIVAEEIGQIVGFGDIEESGYLNRLYVHKDYQGQGIGSALLDMLERRVSLDRITVHASITAKGFFESKGYAVIAGQWVKRKGVLLKNFVMEKEKKYHNR